MIAWVPTVNRIYKYITSNDWAAQSIDLKSASIYDVETAPEKRPRTLKHLLKANHINHSILYHNLQFHNHLAHILGSAYILGANGDQLHTIYDYESKSLEGWEDSPAEITDADWREFLGQKEYQRAYVDFYEDELALKYDYNWTRVAEEYLFTGKHPLINGVISGRMVPFLPCRTLLIFPSRTSFNTSRLRLRILLPRDRNRSPSHDILRLLFPSQIPRRPLLHPSFNLLHHLSALNHP